jgi:hypothetical protein
MKRFGVCQIFIFYFIETHNITLQFAFRSRKSFLSMRTSNQYFVWISYFLIPIHSILPDFIILTIRATVQFLKPFIMQPFALQSLYTMYWLTIAMSVTLSSSSLCNLSLFNPCTLCTGLQLQCLLHSLARNVSWRKLQLVPRGLMQLLKTSWNTDQKLS